MHECRHLCLNVGQRCVHLGLGVIVSEGSSHTCDGGVVFQLGVNLRFGVIVGDGLCDGGSYRLIACGHLVAYQPVYLLFGVVVCECGGECLSDGLVTGRHLVGVSLLAGFALGSYCLFAVSHFGLEAFCGLWGFVQYLLNLFARL